jgi:hypothetical protein
MGCAIENNDTFFVLLGEMIVVVIHGFWRLRVS